MTADTRPLVAATGFWPLAANDEELVLIDDV